MNTDRRTLARRERSALVATMRATGPEAPTLCEGWTTRDLAAHLVVREFRPDAAAGVVVPAFAARLEELRLREAERPWAELLEKIDGGAPWYSPLKYADRVANAAEYLVHHEDVRRAGGEWTARAFDIEDLDRVWSLGTTFAKTSLRRVAARVELRTPPEIRLTKPGAVSTGAALAPLVSITAPPVELLLWAFGRTAVDVDISGAQQGIDAVHAVSRGL
ncbi:TIGR03085 family metal-binding protein [Rhodococcus sp. IEGM 1408]|uniref:TIGR03085 family metal-binding protein n=1 Tax=Rhodococcus sp. IEGM 1408 TaxID=3082220 RepID=UPI002953AD0B|nr:TIGR03085 family metal-binding protein [Rhodococcus sp. IEGM 1408]MDV8000408.1 TIGR03085 family metal-binding protein [Rhodococcus sp. IEGM 1408]